MVLRTLPFIKTVEPIETNIVIFEVNDAYKTKKEFLEQLLVHGVSLIGMGEGKLKIITHLVYTLKQHDLFLKILKTL